ncbi:hypothetical protein CG51_01970 [Haematobacter missouriensis]|uniref:Uncharacterized protein n=1 Tax=Haematobacter missouriensis TaxID=366616 RepID=A0A212ALB9_9RHOB|nr:hypothetical protein [Haematobacter missouriensis]KFI32481.1 hypothetical protein CG51_01970 [Haematobacter missouriensis]OWJ76447.1 hypothetical protein CDV53_07925 [Haematobacter missouriensis]OWJ82281.1 hypothetical protein CDV52_15225 [Haematobacter missouriensis]
MTIQTMPRLPGFVEFSTGAAPAGWKLTRARGKRFTVDYAVAGAEALHQKAVIEAVAIFPDAPGCVTQDDRRLEAPARSLCLLGAGDFSIEAAPGTAIAIIRPIMGTEPADALNDADYAVAEDEILPLLPPGHPVRSGPQVIHADDIRAPADKPRLKILRSRCLSFNWIEYTGLRDRTKLSPHAHEDFEQGSLALAGRFLHHLRTPWGPDATVWREDLHLEAPSPSLCVIPPKVIHTTEGLEARRHLLIDIFAPPRADFLANGWVSNAADYL